MGFEQDWRDLVADTDPTLGVGVAVGGLDGEVWTGGPDMLFPACSISKHVAAFGTLRLVADATIDLDADVNAYQRSGASSRQARSSATRAATTQSSNSS